MCREGEDRPKAPPLAKQQSSEEQSQEVSMTRQDEDNLMKLVEMRASLSNRELRASFNSLHEAYLEESEEEEDEEMGRNLRAGGPGKYTKEAAPAVPPEEDVLDSSFRQCARRSSENRLDLLTLLDAVEEPGTAAAEHVSSSSKTNESASSGQQAVPTAAVGIPAGGEDDIIKKQVIQQDMNSKNLKPPARGPAGKPRTRGPDEEEGMARKPPARPSGYAGEAAALAAALANAAVGIPAAAGDDITVRSEKAAVGIPAGPADTCTPGAYAVEGPGFSSSEATEQDIDSSVIDDQSIEPVQQEPQPSTESSSLNRPFEAFTVHERAARTMTASVCRSEEFTVRSVSGLDDSSTERPRQVFEVENVEKAPTPRETYLQARSTLWLGLVGILLLLVIIVILALGFAGVINGGGGGKDTNTTDVGPSDINVNINATDLSPMTTLERIQAKGELRCADVYLPNGFMYHDSRTGEKTGFYGELCQALAAALSVKAVFVPPPAPWAYLQQVASHDQNVTVDVTIVGHAKNMERSVSGALGGIQEGLSFSTPMLYGGLKFGGDPFHITQCVDKGLKHIEECRSLKVCVSNMTTHYATIKSWLPERLFQVHNPQGIRNLFDGILDGSCNVVVQGNFQVSAKVAAAVGLTDYSVSESFFSKETMAMVTKSNDPEFSDFVESVLQALIVAEQYNITQATADRFPATDLFGPQHKDAFRKAIHRVGNYWELYNKFLEPFAPRSSLNLLNQGTGLISSFPWGRLNVERQLDARPLGFIMQSILKRGILRCGIRTGRPGFAERRGETLSGMDVDLCKALASGLFQGDTEAVEFVELVELEDFVKLTSGEIDVMTGALLSIVNDVKEPTTGMGFAFSQPYFYGYSEEEDNFALATRQDDHDWASFVFWTLNALICADEYSIHSNTSSTLPEQFLFGTSLKRMFRDIVLVSGNYGDMYARNLEVIHPRSGRNMLNSLSFMGPQQYPFPGFLL